MRKGVVIKLNKGRATLIAEDCTFCDIKAFKGMYQGMEVCFNDVDILKRRLVFKANRYVNAACFMLLIFCSYLFLSFYQENIAAYAYVGIDINPSIELALNKKGIIIGSRGLDDEGKELLEKINIKKMDSIEGVKQIIAKTIDMNYLDKNESNEITLYAIMEKENNQNGNELIEKMENAIKEEVVAHSIDGKINAFVSDKEVKDKADKMGVSVGQYISKKAKTTKAEDKVAKYKKDKNDKADKAAEYKKDREDRIAEYKKIKEDRAAEYKKDKADKDAEYKKEKEDKSAKDKKDNNNNNNIKKNKPGAFEDNNKKYESIKNKYKDMNIETKKNNSKLKQKDKYNKQGNEKIKSDSNKNTKNRN